MPRRMIASRTRHRSPDGSRNAWQRADGGRWLRIALRTAHLIAVAYLVGGTAAGLAPREMPLALWGTLGTGLAFTAVEVLSWPVWLLQLRGLAVGAKLLLFGAVLMAESDPMPYLLASMIVGGISSHMPSRFRYYSLWHGRVVRHHPDTPKA